MTEQDERALDVRRASWLIGLSTYGSALTGTAGLVIGFFALLGKRWDVAATSLIAAAIAFGALVNALLRD